MSALRRGHLYWGALDKRRPLLVVSSDLFNARASYVTVVPGSTRLRPLVTHVRLAHGEGGVARPTMLLCEHVQPVPMAEVDPSPLGPPLFPARMREIEAALLVLLGIDIDRRRDLTDEPAGARGTRGGSLVEDFEGGFLAHWYRFGRGVEAESGVLELSDDHQDGALGPTWSAAGSAGSPRHRCTSRPWRS